VRLDIAFSGYPFRNTEREQYINVAKCRQTFVVVKFLEKLVHLSKLLAYIISLDDDFFLA